MADTTVETTRVGEAIHAHHQEILDTLRGHVAAIVDGEGHADPSALVDGVWAATEILLKKSVSALVESVAYMVSKASTAHLKSTGGTDESA